MRLFFMELRDLPSTMRLFFMELRDLPSTIRLFSFVLHEAPFGYAFTYNSAQGPSSRQAGTSLRLFAYFHSCSMRQAHGRQGPPFDYALIFQRCSMRQAHGRQGPQRGCTGNHGGNRGERQECAGSAGKGIARV